MRWVLIVSVIFCSAMAYAQSGQSRNFPVPPIDLESAETVVGDWDGYLIPVLDRSTTPSWAQVTQLLAEEAVRARDVESLRGPGAYNNGYGWVAIPFRNPSEKRIDIKLDSRLGYVTSDDRYLIRPDQPTATLLRGGDFMFNSFEERFPPDRLLSTDWFSLDAGETVIVMIPTTYYSSDTVWYAVTAEGFAKSRTLDAAIISGSFAFRFAFTIFVFALAVILRSRTAALYGLLSIALSAFMAGEYGFLYATLLPDPDLDYLYNELSILAIGLIFTLTSRSFFDLSEAQPRADRIILWTMLASVLLVPFGFFFPTVVFPIQLFHHYFITELAILCSLILYLMNLWCAAQAIRRGVRGALLYLIGGFILFFVMNDVILAEWGLAYEPTAIDHWRNALLSIDIVIFASALIIQTLGLRRDRDAALTAKLDAQNRALAAYAEKEIAEKERDTAKSASRRDREALENTSHDLRQPLTSLRLAIQASRDSDIHLKRKLEAGLDYLVGVLSPVAAEKPNEATVDETVPLQTLFDNLERMFVDQASDKGLLLKIRPSSAIVRVDPIGATRALSNLLSNAIEYTNSGKILLAARRRGDQIDLKVWDTGPGLTAEQVDRVFQRGERGIADDKIENRGLGLASTDRWARENGLHLSVSSEKGQGSVFTIEGLPVASD
ncbi:MAG: sensor histidine kinase [Pseudomonadota bacterium]